MDENKINFSADNENILQKKSQPSSQSTAGVPAYRSRRTEGAQTPAGAGQETVIRPAVKKTASPRSAGTMPATQRRSVPPCKVAASQRTAAASDPRIQRSPTAQRPNAAPRPSGQGQSAQQRPVQGGTAPRQSAESQPVQQRPRPAQSSQQNARPAQPKPAQPKPVQPQTTQPKSDEAAYKARRAPLVDNATLPKETMIAPAPVVKEKPIPPVPVKKAAVEPRKPAAVNNKENKAKDNKKNAKSTAGSPDTGASIMVNIVKAIAYMVIILVVSVFISIFTIRIGNDFFAFVKSDEAIDVTIPENATVDDITEILSDNGIISFPGIFKFYVNLKEDAPEYVAGDYTISPAMSYDELRRAFKEQVVMGTVWITIPEGCTTDEIIDIMVENGIGTREKYIDVINNYDFDFWFIDELENSELKDGRAYRLEGYLFPDTYEFYKASTEEMVISRFLDRFDEVFVEDYKTKAAELGYTVDEILTIASLVEKEAGSLSDFMYVSSVFHNRLNNPVNYPRLESDATTVYAIQIATGVRPDKITPEDNKFDSPYNTYLYDGLTPGPITNPSASAIRYALYPTESTYYYFITDDAGKVYYGSSIGEHEQNIATVKKVNEQLSEG